MATSKHIDDRVTHSVQTPSGGVSPWYQSRVLPAYFFLSSGEHAIVGLFIFNELLDVFIEDSAL
jgi:hypothetical protein